MNVNPQISYEKIDCEICLTEIPISEATNEEACEYVAYFCGLDCYDTWRKQQEEQQD